MESQLSSVPGSGYAALRFWRYDILAGLIVSLVSLPLSLGIAIASGAPPITGLISAIIAGLIFPLLGGANVTISGPAAGLAPVLLCSMTALGHGHTDRGYPLVLGVIFVAGASQVVLSRMNIARWSKKIPSCVVQGMLAAIGLSIIAKQFPYVLGHSFKAHGFFGCLFEVPTEWAVMNGQAFFIAISCLIAIIMFSNLRASWMKMVPVPLIVVVIGVALAQVLRLDPQWFIHVPANPLHGVVFPNFQAVLQDHSIWMAVVTATITIMLVDGVESLATISAIDKIDPFKRTSDPDKTLFAMGVSNICSSLFGGLTIIPGGIKSTACIMAGGRSLWANFYNALFLIGYVTLFASLINLIPLPALAAVLIQIGFHLCRPKIWIELWQAGVDQLVCFAATIVVTLMTDLLWGICAGTALKVCFDLLRTKLHVWRRAV
jgi:carbonic anhydrase